MFDEAIGLHFHREKKNVAAWFGDMYLDYLQQVLIGSTTMHGKYRKGNTEIRTVDELHLLGSFWAYACMVTHIARVWINRVRLPVLHVVS